MKARQETGQGRRVSLTLGSGGARGYAHIGVIEELEARGYEVVALSGCSMGALVAGVYAAGQLDRYKEWVCRLDYFDVLRLVDVTWSPMGAMKASKVMNKLDELIGDIRLEDLSIPVTTVATDLIRQREVWFQHGPLLEAIRASIAVPGVITPVHRGDQVLVDGGLLNPLPIMPTVSTRADLVMAVNVTAQSSQPVTLEALLPPDEAAEEQAREVARDKGAVDFGGWMEGVRGATRRLFGNGSEGEPAEAVESEPGRRAWGRLDMILASFDIAQAALAKYKVAGYPPDVLIEVPKTVCGAYEFHRAEALIALGRHLAREALDRREQGLGRVSGPEVVEARPVSAEGSGEEA
ncbi:MULTISPECIES: patatin-like phospholipase family protein [Halomonas]|uniref:NTE family protein n=1 Tax=Halomonas halophila TaxID=29573 RepID=A0ABQ0U7G6_9GAMM|nr:MULTISPECIES: patatin-like phospholipase family protein [Halomonas]MDR5891033.1 patatin-like phospholipase family protein [Halomonas salina]WJY06545.1 patatin-like phospholipase family protein [Halomonas halophila]GEK74469.1 putative NTE family protein [Halomonas halophila]